MSYIPSRKYKPRCELTVDCSQFKKGTADVRKDCWNCNSFIKQNFYSIECSFKETMHDLNTSK